MYVQRTLLASAVLSALASLSHAQTVGTVLPTVTVTSNPFGKDEGDQILTPAKVLAGDELRNKEGSSLGETLSRELGVSTSGFGAGASRPIIRGLEGSRVKILQNGMSVSDVSGLSNDHAVATESSTARQIEILRGPAALLYGSGAIGGLVNVVNDRIPTTLEKQPTGEAEARYGTGDRSKSASASVDASAGPIGFHVDGNSRRAEDYKIPGYRILDDSTSAYGRLPLSFTHSHSVGVGASYIQSWGHVGASVASVNNKYGIPTVAGSQIDQSQMRHDIDALVNNPAPAFENFKFKLGYTDYKHSELDLSNVPQTNFKNRSLESRWELAHKPVAGWHGTFGIQTENTNFSALNAGTDGPDTVPVTRSTSAAGFLVEEHDFGPVHANAGVRLETVKRHPVTGQDRDFRLLSYSVGGLWTFMPGYGFGATASVAQRAPAADELYSSGPHDATGTFDIGNPTFAKEISHNIELSLQKTSGLVRWKGNVFNNRVKNFVFGQVAGNAVDADGNPGGEYRERVFSQGYATIRGAEAEASYNQRGEGFSARGFADMSRGTLDAGGSLPLQPAKRFGVDLGYKQGPLRAATSLIHALKQDRLATFEASETRPYTQWDANIGYTQKYGETDLTYFAVAKNLLNQDIRLSTSLLKDVSPSPGRTLMIGIRTRF